MNGPLIGRFGIRFLLAVVVLMAIPSYGAAGLPEPVGGTDRLASSSSAIPEAQVRSNAAPTVQVIAPSAIDGDFGANRGNVWDMDSTADIAWTHENFPIEQRPSSEGTVIRGFVPHGAVLGMGLYASSTTNLPSEQYHHLVYRLKISTEGTQNGCITNGRAVLAETWPLWWYDFISSYPYGPHNPPMNCHYGNFCLYYIDLSRNNNSGNWPTWHGSTSPLNPSPWPTSQVKAFAIVPHEWCLAGGAPDYFDVDFVYLTGEIVAREENGYPYTAKWYVDDPDAAIAPVTITSTVRYQEVDELRVPDASPSCDAGFIANGAWKDFDPPVTKAIRLSRTVPPTQAYSNTLYIPLVDRSPTSGETGAYNQSYNLDFSDDAVFTDGKSYYLCIEADDGVSKTYAVSSAPVIRVPLPPLFLDD